MNLVRIIKLHCIQMKDLTQTGILFLTPITLWLGAKRIRINIEILDPSWLAITVARLLFFLFLNLFLINLYLYFYRHLNGYLELMEGMGVRRKEYLVAGVLTNFVISIPFLIPYTKALSSDIANIRLEQTGIILPLFILAPLLCISIFSLILFFYKNKFFMLLFFIIILIEYILIFIISDLYTDLISLIVILFPVGTANYLNVIFLVHPLIWLALIILLFVLGVLLWRRL